MIIFTRTFECLPGKGPEARKNALASANHLRTSLGVTMYVSIPLSGNPAQVRFTSHWDSLAALEAGLAKAMSDPRYQEMSAKRQPGGRLRRTANARNSARL